MIPGSSPQGVRPRINLSSLRNSNSLKYLIIDCPPALPWETRPRFYILKQIYELDEFCKNSDLSNFKRPKAYVFIKEIPKSPTGKILRRKILSGEYELDN